jgi:molybdopterin-guanine dinucleotide biosynthesis protein
MKMSPITVAVSGFSSEVGKTTLLCELLRAFPGWEAIKMTRGHYRSCGKDPHACCVSHLLGDEPVIRSGRAQTYAPEKDTGRYWDAGASNVHWVIVTDSQVERGIKLALERVQAPGVLIEGNSFLKFIDADFTIMVARAEGGKLKASARRALPKSSALYLFENEGETLTARARFALWSDSSADKHLISALPVFTRDTLPQLVSRIREIHSAFAA